MIKEDYEEKEQYCYWGMHANHISKRYVWGAYILGIIMGLFGAWVL